MAGRSILAGVSSWRIAAMVRFVALTVALTNCASLAGWPRYLSSRWMIARRSATEIRVTDLE